MKTEAGELIVGAYLKVIWNCDVVTYNSRPPGGGLRGLEEIDVIGLQFQSKTAYLCEVTTHLNGLDYGGNPQTVERVIQKFQRLRAYAEDILSDFPNRHLMFWSPVVPQGYIIDNLRKVNGLELIINQDYTRCIDELREKARSRTNDENNDSFRLLQLLEHLRR
jgi:hypothetical protein